MTAVIAGRRFEFMQGDQPEDLVIAVDDDLSNLTSTDITSASFVLATYEDLVAVITDAEHVVVTGDDPDSEGVLLTYSWQANVRDVDPGFYVAFFPLIIAGRAVTAPTLGGQLVVITERPR